MKFHVFIPFVFFEKDTKVQSDKGSKINGANIDLSQFSRRDAQQCISCFFVTPDSYRDTRLK